MTPERLAEIRAIAHERHSERKREREEFKAYRKAGLVWRHAAKLARLDPPPDLSPDELDREPDPSYYNDLE